MLDEFIFVNDMPKPEKFVQASNCAVLQLARYKIKFWTCPQNQYHLNQAAEDTIHPSAMINNGIHERTQPHGRTRTVDPQADVDVSQSEA